ncbi:hypothetical protein I552_4959 [Mycobacterium xenopi 3993]|nr:hypothetical protein I552_4959 [Mycobacterium xenopi 3993]
MDGEIVEIEADITSGYRACTWWACPTPPCRSPGTESAPPSPTAAISGR